MASRSSHSDLIFALLFAVVLLLIPSQSLAGSVAGFKEKYLAAEAKLEEQYRNIDLDGTYTLTDRDGKVFQKDQIKMTRSGDLVRSIEVMIISGKPKWPMGSVSVSGGSSDKFYLLLREAGASKFRYVHYGINRNLPLAIEQSFSPLVRAFTTPQGSIKDVMSKEEFTVSTVNSAKYDDQDVIEVTGALALQGATRTMHLTLNSDSLKLLRWECEAPAGPAKMLYSKGIVEYGHEFNGLAIKRCEEWFESKENPGIKEHDRLYEIQSCMFAPLPVDKFTPESAMRDASALQMSVPTSKPVSVNSPSSLDVGTLATSQLTDEMNSELVPRPVTPSSIGDRRQAILVGCITAAVLGICFSGASYWSRRILKSRPRV